MKNLSNFTNRLLVGVIAIVVVMLGIVVYQEEVRDFLFTPSSPVRSVDSPSALPATSTNPVTPTRLRIPAIGVDAAVESVGVNDAGNMAAPSDWRDVSWYQPGFAPGEQGNAVFSGHLDWDGNQAVFWDLNDLQPGDLVHVVGADRRLTYIVTGTKEYDYQVADTTPIFGKSNISQIKLITCDGEFIEGSDTYEKRLIVTARLITANGR